MTTIMERFRVAALIGAVALTLAFAAETRAQNQSSNGNWDSRSNNNTWPYAKTGRSPVLAVVGDVACQPGETEPPGEKAGENCDGDTAQNLWASQAATAQQIENMKPDIVALVGDEQYQVGQYSDFESSYDLTYGAFKMITRPAPGNHEFYFEHGATGVAGYGYFSYFNGVAQITTTATPGGTPAGSVVMATISGIPNTGGSNTSATPCCSYTPGIGGTFTQPVPNSDGQAGHFEPTGGLGTGVYQNGPQAGTTAPVGVGDGWYSYNLGGWHLISLNIECETQPGGCSNSGTWFAAELAWLQRDLEENHSACTLAYWHQPTFSAANSLTNPEGPTAAAFWQLLYQYNADLVLNGHDHLYARYRPLQPVYNASTGAWTGVYNPNNGIREFIVGTGGETLDAVAYGNDSDPTGNPNFNTDNLEAATGQFWGVMALTLNPNGYAWDYESALKDPAQPTGPASFSDKGFGTCHGGRNGGGNNQGQNNNNQGQNQ
jgi:acid phosphatase type 7